MNTGASAIIAMNFHRRHEPHIRIILRDAIRYARVAEVSHLNSSYPKLVKA